MNENFIQFIGHSSALVHLDGITLTVDLNLSSRVGGLFKRHGTIGLDLNNLPKVDAFLVTHAHYDHLDIFSYKYFDQKIPFIAPVGFASLINKFLHNPVIELELNSKHFVNNVAISAIPTQHYGFRISGLNYTKCNGYIIQCADHTVYHPGDTGYGPHFKQIADMFSIDVAFLPIGAFEPRSLLGHQHLNPQEALQAFEDLHAKVMVPIHWGAFRLGMEPIDEPLRRLKALLENNPLKDRVKILQPGEKLELGSL